MSNAAEKVEEVKEPVKEFMAYLPESTYEELRATAFKERKKMTEVVRDSLEMYFKKARKKT